MATIDIQDLSDSFIHESLYGANEKQLEVFEDLVTKSKAFMERHSDLGQDDALIVVEEALDILLSTMDARIEILKEAVRLAPVGSLRDEAKESLQETMETRRPFARYKKDIKDLPLSKALDVCAEVGGAARYGYLGVNSIKEALEMNRAASPMQRWVVKASIDVQYLPSDVARITKSVASDVKSFFTNLF